MMKTTTICSFYVGLFVMAVACQGSDGVVVSIDFTDPIFSKLDEEGKNLIREYASAYPKIKRFYGNIRMDVTEKTFRTTDSQKPLTYVPLNTPPILESERSFEVRYNTSDGDTRSGGFARVDSQAKYQLIDDPQILGILGQDVQVNYEQRISIITPEMGYSLSKSDQKKQFHSLNVRRNRDTFLSTVGVAVLEFDTAPFAVGALPIDYILFQRAPYLAKNHSYFILSAQCTENQDEQVVKIESCIEDHAEVPPRIYTWALRLSRKNWVVKDILEQGWTLSGVKYWTRYRCEYDGEYEGMPLLSSYQIDFGIYDTDEAQTERTIRQIRYEVTKIVPGPVDLSEFDVAQFLPPGVRIGEVTPAGLSAVRIAAIVIGILLVIFGIYMKIRIALRERRNKKP